MIDIDSLLNLKEGESLMILCLDKRHANAVKQRYWRGLKKASLGHKFVISIKTYKFNLYVCITKVESHTFIQTKNGTMKDLISPEDLRKIELMQKDGLSKEEILSSFPEDKREEIKEHLENIC